MFPEYTDEKPSTHIFDKLKTFSHRLAPTWSAPRASSVSVCQPRLPDFLYAARESRRRGRSPTPLDPWNTPPAWWER